MRNLASAFLKLFNKTSKFDKTLKIYANGVDNNYPDFVESVIAESVTASTCSETKASYISGKGFGEENDKIIVHKEKETTLLQLGKDIAFSLADHKGVFIHVNYNGNYDIKNIDVLPFSHCRVGKKDDDSYNGKILVCNDWSDIKKAKKAKVIDVFNPDKRIIKKQVTKAGGFQKYKGQILYFKKGKYTYPLSRLHPALKDAESEAQTSIYKNTSLKKGFFGKTLVITKPLVDVEEGDDDYNNQVAGRQEFRNTIKEFIGVENSDGVMHLELEFNGDKIEDEIHFKQIETNINDKLFAHTEKSVFENICLAYSINPNLIKPKDNSMFSSSGETYQQMKLDLQEKTESLRSDLEEIVNKLMKVFSDKKENLQIIPLIPVKDVSNKK